VKLKQIKLLILFGVGSLAAVLLAIVGNNILHQSNPTPVAAVLTPTQTTIGPAFANPAPSLILPTTIALPAENAANPDPAAVENPTVNQNAIPNPTLADASPQLPPADIAAALPPADSNPPTTDKGGKIGVSANTPTNRTNNSIRTPVNNRTPVNRQVGTVPPAGAQPSGGGYSIAVQTNNPAANRYHSIARQTGYMERYPQLASSEFTTRDGQRLVKDAAEAFDRMRAAARQGGVSLSIKSGFRDIATQEGIFKRKGGGVSAAEFSAPPGHSQHHTGLALDLNSLSPSFRNSREYRWLKANAPQYGFMLSYENNESRCDLGPHNEPWHWVYIGKPAARSLMEQFIARANQCGYNPERP
jgi:LAS superfamily LD-carboxypeptidase LdcB